MKQDAKIDSSEKAPRLKRKHVLGFAAVIGIAWLATPVFLKWYYPDDPSLRGAFGDMFGAVNALFTGMALLGAVWAILLQTEELELQRAELKKSTAEFAKQNEILTEQLRAAKSAQQAAEAKERVAASPFFRYKGGSSNGHVGRLIIENAGADVFDVETTIDGAPALRDPGIQDVWRSGETYFVDYAFDDAAVILGSVWTLRFSYVNKLGERGTAAFVGVGHENKLTRLRPDQQKF